MPSINPYDSQEALRYSNYGVLHGANYSPLHGKQSPLQEQTQQVALALKDFLVDNQHPCIIARSTIRGGSCRFGLYPALGSKEATAGLSRDLVHFLHEREHIKHPYASYMAVFNEPVSLSERDFEAGLWKQLENLKAASEPHYEWDSSTSDNPVDDNFGFSFGGKAFYVVGMHANSSRQARQFAYPMLVFNLHEQFEQMRSRGTYEKVKKIVRKNDLRLQGEINPMLQDFGKASEARQYSGRAVSEDWKCPFLHS